MREVIFRGKRVDNGDWVHGDLVQIENEVFIYDYDIGDNGICDIQQLSQIKWQVDPATVGQYTGLKDKNGVEIYEADILEIVIRNYSTGSVIVRERKAVEFKDCKFGVEWGRGFVGLDGFSKTHTTFEILGNTFDNPELLGGAT